MSPKYSDLHSLFRVIDDDAIFNPQDVAELLMVSLETVRRWCRTGKLTAYSFGGKYIIMGSDLKQLLLFAKNKTKVERILSAANE